MKMGKRPNFDRRNTRPPLTQATRYLMQFSGSPPVNQTLL